METLKNEQKISQDEIILSVKRAQENNMTENLKLNVTVGARHHDDEMVVFNSLGEENNTNHYVVDKWASDAENRYFPIKDSAATENQNMANNPDTEMTAFGDSEHVPYLRQFIVLAAAFISVIIIIGFNFNMSVLYVEWLREFGTTNSETSLIQSVCSGAFFIGGLISGTFITKFGPRKSGFVGGILASLGIGLSYFASSIVYLVIFIGIISGVGTSLSYISSHAIVGMYSTGKQRIMALAFLALGTGLGGIVFPVLLENLVKEFGWRGSLLIVAGLMLNLSVSSCLYKKPTSVTNSRRDNLTKLNHNQSTSNNMNVEVKNENGCGTEKYTASVENTQEVRRESLRTTEVKHFQDVKNEAKSNSGIISIFQNLFRNKIFILFCFTQAFCLAALNMFLIFAIDYFESKGLSRDQAVNIYLYMNIATTISRFVPGLMKHIPHVSILSIPVICALIGAVSFALLPFTGASYNANIAATFAYGVGLGGITSVTALAMVKLAGQNYSAGLGMAMTLSGIFNVAAGPISGSMRDKTGSYDMSLFSAAIVVAISCILFFITMVCQYIDNTGKGPRLNFEMIVRRKSRRQSSIFAWRRKSFNIRM